MIVYTYQEVKIKVKQLCLHGNKIYQYENTSIDYLELVQGEQQKNTATAGESGTAHRVGGDEVENSPPKNSSQKRMKRCLIAIALTVAVMVLVMSIAAFALAVFNYCYSIVLSTNNVNFISGSHDQLRNETQDALKEQDNIISGQVNQLRNDTQEIEKALTNKDTIISGQVNQLRNESQETDRQLTNDISVLTIQHQHSLSSTRDNISQVRDNLNTIKNDISSLQVQIYCGDGQWNRIAFLNMSDSLQQCPSNWSLFTSNGVRACGRPASLGSSCPGTFYSAMSEYHRVCGRVIGYQDHSPDGFNSVDHQTIDMAYMDGVSVTYGQPRHHIWSYVAGVTERNSQHGVNNCPCSTQAGSGPQLFVGNNYYCESGNPTDGIGSFYANDKLWDSKLCEGTCCSDSKSPPWFSVYLPSPTTEIEVRICGDELTSNENTPIELLEIYVQ